jgi:ubiquinol-cytochrome c reductase cytochrome b subunit
VSYGFVVPARRDPWPNFGLLSLLVASGGLFSGVLLAFHYAPTLEAARDSTAHVETLALGRFLRGVHHWSGTFALVLAALHGARLFWHGEYKAPRQPLWVIGCLLFLVLLGFAYTGYLLAGDERAVTGLRVMEGVAGSTPLVGDALKAAVRGGDAISSAALTRLYAVHAFVLPAALAVLLALFARAWRWRGPARHHGDGSTQVVPAWPDAMKRDGLAALAVMALLVLCAAAFPPALGPAPDPSGAASPDARPEWFFLWVNELLHRVPGKTFLVAGLLPALLVGLAIGLPFYARGGARDPRRRKPEIAVAMAFVLCLAGLTLASFGRAPEGEPPAPADTPTPQVAKVMEKFQCARCHSIDGAESADDTGPPLNLIATGDHPAVRDLFTREFFRRKVGDPRKYWDDTSMNYTPLRLKPTAEELAALERWFYGG